MMLVLPPLSFYSAATQSLYQAIEVCRTADRKEELQTIYQILLASLHQYTEQRQVWEGAKFYARKVSDSRQKCIERYQLWSQWPFPGAFEMLRTSLCKTQCHLNKCEIYLQTKDFPARVETHFDQAMNWFLSPNPNDARQIFDDLSIALDDYVKQRAINLGVISTTTTMVNLYQGCTELKQVWDQSRDEIALHALECRLRIVQYFFNRCEAYLRMLDLYQEADFCLDQAMGRLCQPVQDPQEALQGVLEGIRLPLRRYTEERATALAPKESLFRAIVDSYQRCLELGQSHNQANLNTLRKLHFYLRKLKNCLYTCEKEIKSSLCGSRI